MFHVISQPMNMEQRNPPKEMSNCNVEDKNKLDSSPMGGVIIAAIQKRSMLHC